MRKLSCQEGRIHMKVPLPVYVLCITPTCQLVHMVCTCVWCGVMFVCVLGWLTSAHIPLFNTLKWVWRCLWVLFLSHVCVYVSLCYICASVAYLSTFIVPFQVSVCVCVCDKKKTKDIQRKPDPTRTQQSVWCCFSDLARCVNTHPVQSLATAAWENMEPKHTFHMKAFVK